MRMLMLHARLPSIPFERKAILMVTSASVLLYAKGLSLDEALHGQMVLNYVRDLLLLIKRELRKVFPLALTGT